MKTAPGFLCRLLTCAMAAMLIAAPIFANEPPTAAQVRQYKADGTFEARLHQAHEIGNHLMDPSLVARAEYRLSELAGIPLDMRTPPPASQGLPTTGSPQVLVMLVDFPDYPHSANQDPADIDNKFFGNGDAEQYPFESLRNFYERSSYDQLHIGGNVLGWYTAQNNRSYYENLGWGTGQEALMMEALDYFDAQGHDFTQYDNDNNGTIDSFFIKWTGPDTGWSGFWWAYQWVWHMNTDYTVDGKSLQTYVWSWISNPEGEAYQPQTDIHETGHALGLPDYYDYDDTVGPDGGVGGMDMMHSNNCDHNAFSKFVLDWVTPTVISEGAYDLELNPSGTSPDCVLIMPQAESGVFHEYFMAQYRKVGVANDPEDFINSGLVIWHIDARLDDWGWDFAYDNSYTDHKLLRLMEADGLEEIEFGDGHADAGDFYLPPSSFSPDSTPNSNDYAGNDTHLAIDQLTVPGETAGARFIVDSTVGTQVGEDPVGETPLNVTQLMGAHPNPFNPQTTISFSLEEAALVQLTVFDMSGHRVVELANEVFDAGQHPILWDGRDSAGNGVASGAYFVQMVSNDRIRTSKMLLVR